MHYRINIQLWFTIPVSGLSEQLLHFRGRKLPVFNQGILFHLLMILIYKIMSVRLRISLRSKSLCAMSFPPFAKEGQGGFEAIHNAVNRIPPVLLPKLRDQRERRFDKTIFWRTSHFQNTMRISTDFFELPSNFPLLNRTLVIQNVKSLPFSGTSSAKSRVCL